jgi:transketolase
MDLKHLSTSVRVLCIDSVERAKSGHLGLPLGMADVAVVLFRNHLRFYAMEPDWCNRDRLILSAGHGIILLYSIFYLTGIPDFNLEDL